MCGIVGIYDRTQAGRVDLGRVRGMAQAVAHRGPDGDGFFTWPPAAPDLALGVRRLSILDLESGNQPIFNEDRSVALVFNGEIFNYVELRAELEQRGHLFRTQSDTETIVHVYEDFGTDLFRHLRGMYAFALWDARQENLLLAVDHVGIKPLYLAEHDGRLMFASEVKALLAEGGHPRHVNPNVLDTFLSFGYMLGTETLYDGIRRLAPGHALVIHGSRTQLIRHWSTEDPAGRPRPTDERVVVDEAYSRLAEAVRLHLRSDVPLGLFLSGGIDSASLLALMSQVRPGPVETFSVGYAAQAQPVFSGDETLAAREVASHFGARHRELVLSADDWWSALPSFVEHHEEPNADPAAVSLLALSEMASSHVKVVLSGLGGDEVFCGYGFHRRAPERIRQADWLRRWAPAAVGTWSAGRGWDLAESLYPTLRRVRYLGGALARLIECRGLFMASPQALRRTMSYDGLVFSEGLRARLYSPDLMNASIEAPHTAESFADLVLSAAAEDPADLVQALWIHAWLPGSGLLGLDKVSMAHSLEARVPFFDPPLMTFALSIPSSIRLKGNKYVLRKAMQNDLPPSLLRRPKRPFTTPIRTWLDHELSDRTQEVLLDPSCLGRGWFNPGFLERLVRRHFRGETDQTEVILRLLLFEMWQRTLLEVPSHVPDPLQRVPR